VTVVVLHHGAMCDSADMPGDSYIWPALQRGWLVCVFNRRGHGHRSGVNNRHLLNHSDSLHTDNITTSTTTTKTKKVRLTRPKWNFFGCSEDIHYVTQNIITRQHDLTVRMVTIGLSAGSGTVARHFGEPEEGNDFLAGVGICPGYDISKCMKRFSYPYHVSSSFFIIFKNTFLV
jgi:predicted alpha/beta-fold hydrolase